jgi:hypothetical protein
MLSSQSFIARSVRCSQIQFGIEGHPIFWNANEYRGDIIDISEFPLWIEGQGLNDPICCYEAVMKQYRSKLILRIEQRKILGTHILKFRKLLCAIDL